MTPVERYLSELNRIQLERLAWLEPDAAKVRKYREEDERNGITWRGVR
jgi:hypothetical protein